MTEDEEVRRKGWYEQDGMLLRYLKQHAVDGELTATHREIAEETGIRVGSLARIVDRLEKQGKIKTQVLRDERGVAKTRFRLIEVDESYNIRKVMGTAEKLIKELEETKVYIDWLKDRIMELEKELVQMRRGKRVIEGRVIRSIKLPGGLRNIIVQLPLKERVQAEEEAGSDAGDEGEEEDWIGFEEPEKE